MKRAVLICLCLTGYLASQHVCMSQINDQIKRRSSENSSRRESHSSSSNSMSDDAFTDACCSCIDGCGLTLDLLEILIMGLSDWNKLILEKKDSIPRIQSGDIIIQSGFIAPNSTTIIPRIRYNGALFSTDFRVFTNFERHLDEDDSYTTIDWQIGMLNVLVIPEANIRIGTGIMYEVFSGTLFNEHTFKLDLYPSSFLKLDGEYRLTPDYSTGIIVRHEFSAAAGFKLFDWTKYQIWISPGFLIANYYESVKFNAYLCGISLTIN